VSTPSDDLASRARAIFSRLRSADPVEERSGDATEPDIADSDAAATDSDAADSSAADSSAADSSAADSSAADSSAADSSASVTPEATRPPALAPEPPAATVPLPGSPAPSLAQMAKQAKDDFNATPADVVRPLPRILAIANQKGGVGKTTTAVNLGAGLAELGYRVLIVDLDPQGNATTGLGVNARNLESSVYDALMNETPIEDCIEPTAVRNLFVAPATIDLAGAEIELVPAFSRELKLRRALDSIKDEFDYTLIDCPPSLGLLTVNGLAAADEVLVPIQCEYYALEGLGQLLRNVQLVQSNLNPKLEVSAIILTMYDARTKLAEQVAQEVRDHFGPKVCRNLVPRTVRLSEAPSFGQPIIVFDPSSRGAIAYRELAKEVSGGAPQRSG
jgi:chromosome partitioning protein